MSAPTPHQQAVFDAYPDLQKAFKTAGNPAFYSGWWRKCQATEQRAAPGFPGPCGESCCHPPHPPPPTTPMPEAGVSRMLPPLPHVEPTDPRPLLVYLEWSKAPESAARFWKAYSENPPGIDHRVLLVSLSPGAEWAAPERGQDARLSCDDAAFDIGAYYAAIKRFPAPAYVLMGSHFYPIKPNWLKAVMDPILLEGVSLVGTNVSNGTGVWGTFPNGHVRTGGFAITRALAEKLSWPDTRSKNDAMMFEHGPQSMTKQASEAGFFPVLVGADGGLYHWEDWPDSATAFLANQENLLIADKQSDRYAKADEKEKEMLGKHMWGDGWVRERNDPATPFEKDFYRRRCFRRNRWMGIAVQKYPTDMLVYADLFHTLRPAALIETGSKFGGSALFFAHLMDLIGTGRVVSVDIEADKARPRHPRIAYITGDSKAPETVKRVKSKAGTKGPVLVVLDSDHRKDHVLAEMEAYGPLVSVGSFMVVEDTNINGHPVAAGFGPGPWEAVEEYLGAHGETGEAPAFARDPTGERFIHTASPGGWLRRVR